MSSFFSESHQHSDTDELTPFSEFYKQQNVAAINDEAIKKFAIEFCDSKLDDYLNRSSTVLPLNFSDHSEEINFEFLLNLLQVGSNFENQTSLANQDTLKDVITYGVMSMFLTSMKLNSATMVSMSSPDISEMFSLPRLSRNTGLENSLSTGGFTVESRGGLADYADLLAITLVSTGRQLMERGFESFTSFLMKVLESNNNIPEILRSICSEILSFDDRHFVSIQNTINNSEDMLELCFFKNIRRLLLDVMIILNRNQDKLRYSIPNIESLALGLN